MKSFVKSFFKFALLPLWCVLAMRPGRSVEQGRPWFYRGRHRTPGPSGIGVAR